MKWLGAIVLLIIAIGVFDILRWEAKSFAAQRERNKPKVQNFSFLGQEYQIPAGELPRYIAPDQQFRHDDQSAVDDYRILVPYLFGSIHVYDPTLFKSTWSYSDLTDKTNPYETYGEVVDYNTHFLFSPRLNRIKEDKTNGIFISRENLFAGQRIILRCYQNGLDHHCILQTYRPLNTLENPLFAIQDILEFRHQDSKPCKKRAKEKEINKHRKNERVYYSCFYIGDVIEALPSELARIESSMIRWRENAQALPR